MKAKAVWHKKKGIEIKTAAFAKLTKVYPPVLIKLLTTRGLSKLDEIDKFLNPNFDSGLFNPLLLKNIKRSVKLLSDFIDQQKKISIYTDYDADGICAGAILADLFDEIKYPFEIYIPDRRREGYGLNKNAIKFLKEQKVDLIITCDCASNNKDEIDFARELGLEVIVIDHHQLHVKYDQSYFIVNPKQPGDRYPFKELCGAGLVYKFVQAFLIINGQEKKLQIFGKWLLDLLVIATVADLVPLVSENRVLSHYGLMVIKKTRRWGIKALAEAAGTNLLDLNSEKIGFVLAPRLNAAGRINHASSAYKLLITKNLDKVKGLARELDRQNRLRQNITGKVVQEAKILFKGKKEKILIGIKKNWDQGVLGIAASKLMAEFHRPVILLQQIEDQGVGSARSPKNFNIINSLDKCSPLLIRYGGHAQAAGLKVSIDKLSELKSALHKIADRQLKNSDLVEQIEYDLPIKLADLSWELYSYLEKLEPFGLGNHQPIFRLNKLTISNKQYLGNLNKHLKLTLQSGDHFIFALSFDSPVSLRKLAAGETIDVLATLRKNQWRNKQSLELLIIDWKITK
ncbi:MAG: hypothetical protein ACD_68C00072G0002 [uncultured bacterium]|nr:MAG: hypothetical protein ACD_68C00072G0002 [uncultured bacterium]